jgi:hypothetical protein
MHPVNLAKELPADAGRGIVWLVLELCAHPIVRIIVGILLICVLIIGVVRIVQMLRGKM